MVECHVCRFGNDDKRVISFRPGAGLLYPAEQSRGLEDFAVAFGGGGVRSGGAYFGKPW